MADPNWGDLVLSGQDGGAYAAQRAASKNSILQLIRQFGQSSALSAPEAAAYGITPADLSGVDDNPYSTVKQLAKTLTSNNYGITNNAAAHGAEFSGAHQAQLLGARDQANQANYDATQGLNSGLNSVDTTDAGNYGTAIQNLMNNYVAPLPAVAAPAPAAAPAAPPAAAAQPPFAGATQASSNFKANPSGFNPSAPQNAGLPALTIPRPPKVPVGIHAQ